MLEVKEVEVFSISEEKSTKKKKPLFFSPSLEFLSDLKHRMKSISILQRATASLAALGGALG